ncbi:MAG TPA: EAL domain-containing protein [Pseudonocardia sp.]|nr:EAL domain-containing protein [Pseudonocardia sp.]
MSARETRAPGSGAQAPPEALAATAAHATSVGLVVLQGGAARWLNSAAWDLAAGNGGGWSGPRGEELLAVLRQVEPGRGRRRMSWVSPGGATRQWEVGCRALAGDGEAGLLYEIVDRTDLPERGPEGDARWRMARIEALAGMGSWEWHVRDGRVEWSDALLEMFGYPPGTSLDYPSYRTLLHPEDVPMIEGVLADALRTAEPFTYTHRMYLADRATLRVFECYGEVLCDAAGEPVRVLGTARDVTEQHRVREELTFLAGHDPLTGLANRRGVTARLAECVRGPAGGALLLVDVDNFKEVNDRLGHAAGDEVMRSVARVLSSHLESDALLGRLGGDEFAVVVPRGTAAEAAELGDRLCRAAAHTPIPVPGEALQVTVSIGVAPLEPVGDEETALAHADLALYEAKDAGRNRVRVFCRDRYGEAARRVSVLQRVGDALDSGAMALDAQPIVDLATGAVRRHEILVRLRDGLAPALGPGEFLPAVERTDLGRRLDRWVIEGTIRVLARPWARGERFDVNVSGRSLDDPALGEWILGTLRRADVAPHRLGLEITETAALSGIDAARRLARLVTSEGCGFTLDGFGAGLTSFAYLKSLPLTTVKIAGELVAQVDAEPVDQALVGAVAGAARRLGLSTVAEHVDRPELVDVLRKLGVDQGQGFHLGRPRLLDGPPGPS